MLFAKPDIGGAVFLCREDRVVQPSILPVKVECHAAPQFYAGEMSLLPVFRQCGQQFDMSSVGLTKHLGDAGCSTEVSVDLEGRMGVEKIILHGPCQQLTQILMIHAQLQPV